MVLRRDRMGLGMWWQIAKLQGRNNLIVRGRLSWRPRHVGRLISRAAAPPAAPGAADRELLVRLGDGGLLVRRVGNPERLARVGETGTWAARQLGKRVRPRTAT